MRSENRFRSSDRSLPKDLATLGPNPRIVDVHCNYRTKVPSDWLKGVKIAINYIYVQGSMTDQ